MCPPRRKCASVWRFAQRISIRAIARALEKSGPRRDSAKGFDPAQGFPVTADKRGTIEIDTPAGARISVLGLRFSPPNNAPTTIPALANVGTGGGSIAHLASGGDGWQTTFVLVNTGTSATSATLNFFDDQTGAPLSLPLSFPQSGGTTAAAPSYTQALAAGATLVIVSSGAPQLLTGSAQLSTTGNVSGFVIFRHNDQEAVVPLESRNANGYVLAFDNTNGTFTGVALNAVSAQQVNVPVTVRDDTGVQIATDTIALAANNIRRARTSAAPSSSVNPPTARSECLASAFRSHIASPPFRHWRSSLR